VLFHHASFPTPISVTPIPSRGSALTAWFWPPTASFMASSFFCPDLFVWPGLAHKSPATFFRDRRAAARPAFAVAAFTVIPIAYYAIQLRQHPDISFSAFWWKTVHRRPWPSRPDMVRLGVAGLRSHRRACCTESHPALARSHQPLSQRGFEPAGRISFCCLLAVTPSSMSGAGLLWPSRWFRVRTIRRSNQPRAAVCGTSSSAPG